MLNEKQTTFSISQNFTSSGYLTSTVLLQKSTILLYYFLVKYEKKHSLNTVCTAWFQDCMFVTMTLTKVRNKNISYKISC
jgi:hypothetical protein